MEMIKLITENGRSGIYIGDVINTLPDLLPDKRVIVITDRNVFEIYGSLLSHFSPIVLNPGEESKSLKSLTFIVEQLLEMNADRECFLLGVGGGVVCDITGFAASIYMRGCEFGYIATSLLAMVDASIGGKTGINLMKNKNILGTFAQPRFVLCDPIFLETLPHFEIRNGLVEAFKHCLIGGKELFDTWREKTDAILGLEPEIIMPLITQSVHFKANIVKQDEKENGIRKILNFGHTIGHALESTYGISHGEAVAAGIFADISLSVSLMNLDQDAALQIQTVLRKLGYTPYENQIDVEAIKKFIRNDKKKMAHRISYVLISEIGKANIYDFTIDELFLQLDRLYGGQ